MGPIGFKAHLAPFLPGHPETGGNAATVSGHLMVRRRSSRSHARLRALQLGERCTEQGITFERLANGDGLFSVNVMVDGERIHRNLGRESEGVTRTTAEEFIAKVRQDAREGRLDLPKRRKVPLTLATAALLYLDRLDQEGGKEIERKRQRLEQCLVPFLGKVRMGQITSFDIERYKKHRLAQSIQSRKKLQPGQTLPTNRPATVNRELATLSHLLNKAVEWGWIERPPAKIRKLKEDNGRIVFLTAAQADNSARKHRSRWAFDLHPPSEGWRPHTTDFGRLGFVPCRLS
jgi:hypothetical protein